MGPDVGRLRDILRTCPEDDKSERCYYFSSAVQLRTTVKGEKLDSSSVGVTMRNFWPSEDTVYGIIGILKYRAVKSAWGFPADKVEPVPTSTDISA